MRANEREEHRGTAYGNANDLGSKTRNRSSLPSDRLLVALYHSHCARSL